MDHQRLLWNMHCVATVVLRKQLNFKSAVIRSNRSSCFVLFAVVRIANRAHKKSVTHLWTLVKIVIQHVSLIPRSNTITIDSVLQKLLGQCKIFKVESITKGFAIQV